MPLIHPFTHTPTAIGCHARYQARQEQLRVRGLAQGHYDTPRVGIEPATLRLPDDSSYPEPYRPICVGCVRMTKHSATLFNTPPRPPHQKSPYSNKVTHKL